MTDKKYLRLYIKVCPNETYLCYYKGESLKEIPIEGAKANKIHAKLVEKGFFPVWGDFGKCLVISYKKPLKEK
jgi:hypothetical protein